MMGSASLPPAVTSLHVVDMTSAQQLLTMRRYGMHDIQNPNHELRTSPEIILKNWWKVPKYNEAAKDIGLISAKR